MKENYRPDGDDLEAVVKMVQTDFQKEFLSLIQANRFGIYQEFLLKSLSGILVDYKALFDYGIEHLSSLNHRPDYELATYFLALSSLRDIAEEFRSIATDSMIFCENESDSVPESDASKIMKEYKERGPLLLKKSQQGT